MYLASSKPKFQTTLEIDWEVLAIELDKNQLRPEPLNHLFPFQILIFEDGEDRTSVRFESESTLDPHGCAEHEKDPLQGNCNHRKHSPRTQCHRLSPSRQLDD